MENKDCSLNFRLTAKQNEAVEIMVANQTTLLEGGTRSAKTFLIIRAMLIRALLVANSWHIGLRLRRTHINGSVWQQTLPQVLDKCGWNNLVELNHSDMSCTIKQNKSVLIFDGLDDKERVDKILGKEYSTIFLNEVSQIGFNEYETLTTRLNPSVGLTPKVWLDWNPTSTNHWAHKMFRKRKFPDGRDVPSNDFGVLLMNPSDNRENISETLFNTLNNLSGNKRRRFLDGLAGEDEGNLWKRENIIYGNAPETLNRVVIGVDPSGSADGDEVGIIVAAIGSDGKYYILQDYSLNGSPLEWSNEVQAAFERYKADAIVAEKNFGGDMVLSTITDMGRRNINVKLVSASRGKAIRAEPIAAMYERGEIIHTKQFHALEDELCFFKQGVENQQDNKMDALVWALTELTNTTFCGFDIG